MGVLTTQTQAAVPLSSLHVIHYGGMQTRASKDYAEQTIHGTDVDGLISRLSTQSVYTFWF